MNPSEHSCGSRPHGSAPTTGAPTGLVRAIPAGSSLVSVALVLCPGQFWGSPLWGGGRVLHQGLPLADTQRLSPCVSEACLGAGGCPVAPCVFGSRGLEQTPCLGSSRTRGPEAPPCAHAGDAHRSLAVSVGLSWAAGWDGLRGKGRLGKLGLSPTPKTVEPQLLWEGGCRSK